MSRPTDGNETKINKSIRLEPKTFENIVNNYGSLSNWIKLKIIEDEKLRGKNDKVA